MALVWTGTLPTCSANAGRIGGLGERAGQRGTGLGKLGGRALGGRVRAAGPGERTGQPGGLGWG